MNNYFPISKKQIKNSIRYDWYKYVLIFIATTLVMYYAYHLKNRLKENEKIQIFTSAEIINYDIELQLESKFEKDGILDYKLYHFKEDDPSFNLVFEQQGLYNSDIILISENLKDNDGLISNCIFFDDDLINQIKAVNPLVSFVEKDGNTFGVSIFKSNDEIYNSEFKFSQYFDIRDSYFMAIPKLSFNSGKYGTKSKDNDIMAITTFLYLLGM